MNVESNQMYVCGYLDAIDVDCWTGDEFISFRWSTGIGLAVELRLISVDGQRRLRFEKCREPDVWDEWACCGSFRWKIKLTNRLFYIKMWNKPNFFSRNICYYSDRFNCIERIRHSIHNLTWQMSDGWIWIKFKETNKKSVHLPANYSIVHGAFVALNDARTSPNC